MNKLELFTDSEVINRMIDAGLNFKIFGKELFYLIHGVFPRRVKMFLNSDIITLKSLLPESDFFDIVEFDNALWIKEKYPFSSSYQFEVYLLCEEISDEDFIKSKIDIEPLSYNKIYIDSKLGIVDKGNVIEDLKSKQITVDNNVLNTIVDPTFIIFDILETYSEINGLVLSENLVEFIKKSEIRIESLSKIEKLFLLDDLSFLRAMINLNIFNYIWPDLKSQFFNSTKAGDEIGETIIKCLSNCSKDINLRYSILFYWVSSNRTDEQTIQDIDLFFEDKSETTADPEKIKRILLLSNAYLPSKYDEMINYIVDNNIKDPDELENLLELKRIKACIYNAAKEQILKEINISENILYQILAHGILKIEDLAITEKALNSLIKEENKEEIIKNILKVVISNPSLNDEIILLNLIAGKQFLMGQEIKNEGKDPKAELFEISRDILNTDKSDIVKISLKDDAIRTEEEKERAFKFKILTDKFYQCLECVKKSNLLFPDEILNLEQIANLLKTIKCQTHPSKYFFQTDSTLYKKIFKE